MVCRVAEKLHATVMIGRGYSSISARKDLARRFAESGKDLLILLIVSDFDTEGVDIAETLASSIHDEFGIDREVKAVKVALTWQQVQEFNLPPGGKAKKTSSRYKSFVSKYGENVYELEALEPAQLERLIEEALSSVIDHKLLQHERDSEKQESRELHVRRRRALEPMGC